MNRILADAARSIAGIEAITVYDLEGRAVASTEPAAVGAGHPEPALLDRARSEPVVDHVYLDPAGRPRALLTGPMLLDGVRLGVASLRSRVRTLHAAVADTSGLGRTGEAILVRPAGDGGMVLLAPTRFRPHATMRAVAGECCVEPGGSADGVACECRDYRGRKVLAVARAIPDTDWRVVVKKDMAEVLAHLHRTGVTILAASAVLVLVVVLVALRVARRLSRPLEELAGAAEGIAAGDFSRRVRVRSFDELTSLATSFNAMSEHVAAARDGLEENIRQLNREIARRRRTEAERERLIGDLTHAMAEIRTLEGIIPICASCKKIRDDQGYWNQLETYIAEHSNAHFSHGLCPDCLARYEEQERLAERPGDDV
jgi:HAMP domain-containing protein